MKRLLLFFLVFISGCIAVPTPSFYSLQEYPPTWTPAPTPTNSPPGPTATHVIQRTPGAAPTRDPNARVLPTSSRGGIGVWMELDARSPQAVLDLLPRAQVIVTDGAGANARKPNQTLLFSTSISLTAETLAPAYGGIVLEKIPPDAATALSSLRNRLKPRLVLARSSFTDMTGLDTALLNLDGVLLENFLRPPDAPPDQFPDEAAWRKQLGTLSTLSSAPNTVVLTATRFSRDMQIELPVVEQWVNYALGSFLLGANNTHAFFGFPDAKQQQLINVPALNAQLGLPNGGTFKGSGVYQRRFTRGLVLVNPTTDKHVVALSRPYQDASGAAVPQLEMLPHTGVVLLNAE